MLKKLPVFTFLILFLNIGVLFSDTFENAIRDGEYWKVKAMIDLGRDVNKKATSSSTPLNLAGHYARKDIVVLLVENGARVDLPDPYLTYPLAFTARGLGNGYALERLDDFLWIAQYLIDCGADVDSRDGVGYVAIDWAVHYDKVSNRRVIEFAYLLIRNGANLDLVGPLVNEDQLETLKAYQASLNDNGKDDDDIDDEPELENNEFTLLDIGTLDWDNSCVYSINDTGQICGSIRIKKKNSFFVWNTEEGLNFINLPSSAIPKKINNHGQIAGEYKDKKGKNKGFFRSKDLGFIDIGTLGGRNTWVYQINDKGQIVGGSETGKKSHIDKNKKVIHAFVWEYSLGSSKMRDLGILKGDNEIEGDESIATSINNHGEIVGFSNEALIKANNDKVTRGCYQAVRWSAAGPEKLLGLYHEESKALFINNNSQIAFSSTTKKNLFIDTNGYIYELPFENVWRAVLTDDNYALVNEQFLAHYDIQDDNDIKVTSAELGSFLNPENNQEGYWKKLDRLIDINNAHQIPVAGQTIYEESHALLMFPDKAIGS